MVETVLDFVRQTPQVWPQNPAALAGIVAAADGWTSLAMLGGAGPWRPYFIYTLAWGDDGYSKDLSEIFFKQFTEQNLSGTGMEDVRNVADVVPYSTGD